MTRRLGESRRKSKRDTPAEALVDGCLIVRSHRRARPRQGNDLDQLAGARRSVTQRRPASAASARAHGHLRARVQRHEAESTPSDWPYVQFLCPSFNIKPLKILKLANGRGAHYAGLRWAAGGVRAGRRREFIRRPAPAVAPAAPRRQREPHRDAAGSARCRRFWAMARRHRQATPRPPGSRW